MPAQAKCKRTMLKYCYYEKHHAPLTEFTKDKNKPDGLATICKSCRSKQNKKVYQSRSIKKRESELVLTPEQLQLIDDLVQKLVPEHQYEKIILEFE